MKVAELLLWNTDRYPYRKTFETVHRILRATGSFPRENADREQHRHAEGDGLDAVKRSPSISAHRTSRMTGVAQTQVYRILQLMDSIHITCKEHNTFYWKITSAV